ncbi:hypothetical protein WA026_021957 [Henosepilachna vigintioctopunctata]|uniref:Uncharacterized protein n=1 Tax=Henosepilachna vigintioctopunctata TaxID=420089 RepID=A0AAW1VAR5_9CUCU
MVCCVTGIGKIEDLFSGNPGEEVDLPNQESSSSGQMESDRGGTISAQFRAKDKNSILRTDVDGIAENLSTSMSSNVTVNETNQETNVTNKLTVDKSKALVAKNVADFFKNSDTKNENTSGTQSSNTEVTLYLEKKNVN